MDFPATLDFEVTDRERIEELLQWKQSIEDEKSKSIRERSSHGARIDELERQARDRKSSMVAWIAIIVSAIGIGLQIVQSMGTKP